MGVDSDGQDQTARWLAVLRDGSEGERQRARTELGLILERNGHLADAAEAYRANVDARVSDRRPYERLAALARAGGDASLEAATLRALADLLDPPPISPDLARRGRGLGGGGCSDDTRDMKQEKAPVSRRPVNGARRIQARPVSRPGRGRAALSVGVVAIAMVAIVLGVRHLPDVLLPTPTPEASRVAVNAASASPPSPVAAASSPAPVDLRLVVDVSTPPAPQAAVPSPSPAPSPAPLPERCASATLHFPETRDTEAAVRAAYHEYLARQGVTIDPTSTLFAGLGQAYAARHAEIVAGWMAVALQREQRGLRAFSLADYVASDVVVATGPGEYQLRATVSPQGWAEIRAWPATICEGAFIRDPANAHWVDLMQASVGDITWALPTPLPR
jgi:hypothetical protein